MSSYEVIDRSGEVLEIIQAKSDTEAHAMAREMWGTDEYEYLRHKGS